MGRTLPQVVGPTEAALGALLDRQLDGSPIAGRLEWVVLNRAAVDARSLVDDVARMSGEPSDRVTAAVGQLRHDGLLDPHGTPTTSGTAALAAARQRVGAATAALVAGVADADLAVVHRVLDLVRERAERSAAAAT